MPVTVVVRSASDGPRGSTSPSDSPSLTFDGPRVVLGRGAGSDVRLPDPSVSLRHATIRATGAEYAIVDEGSTNGTWVGGIKLVPQSPRIVKSGDLLRVGRVWLELAIGHKAATPDLGLATRDLALSLVRRAMDAMGDDTVAKVRVAEGADMGAELRLFEPDREYVLGRAERCDLPLADEDASREHAIVTRRGGQVFLRDLGSRNGVYLGDALVPTDREVLWRPPTMARIGRTVLALDEPVSLALAELEACDDERLGEEDAPPPPPPSVVTGSPSVAPPSSSMAQAPGNPADAAPAPPSVAPQVGNAPIAEVATTTTHARPRRRGWTATDLLVVAVALGIIGASIAGLVWVLK